MLLLCALMLIYVIFQLIDLNATGELCLKGSNTPADAALGLLSSR